MLLIHTLALYLLPFIDAKPAENHGHGLNRAFGGGDTQQTFEELLQALPEETLHAALHTHVEPKFQDGVYEDDRTAVAKVHEENPSLASRLIAAARLEFVKRQADNSTTSIPTSDGSGSTTTPSSTQQLPSSTPVSSTTSPSDNGGGSPPPTTSQGGGGGAAPSSTTQNNPPPTSQGGSGGTTTAGGGSGSTPSSSAAVVIPVQITTTNAQGQTVVSSTSAVVASPSVSAVVLSTFTGSDGSTTVSSATVAGAVVETTNAAGQTVQSTVPVSTFRPQTTSAGGASRFNTVLTNTDGLPITLSGITSGQVIRTTDAQGHTFVTTFTPGGGRISEVVFKTSTNAQGQAVTLTSFVAAPSAGDSSGNAGGSPSNTGKPSLQSGIAAQPAVGRELLAAVGAGMLGAAALI